MRVQTVARLLAGLPPEWAGGLASAAAPVMAALSPAKVRSWRTNLRAAGLDERDPAAVRSAAPFRHHILLLYESLAMIGGRRFAISREGEDHLRALSREGRGFLVASAHIGNWHLGARDLNEVTGRVVHSVAGTQLLPGWSEDLTRAWRDHGIELHPRTRSAVRFARILRDGGIVALQLDGDQHARPGLATRGVALLSRRTGCPILPAVCERERPGRLVVRYGHPLAGGRLAPDPESLARILIEMIRGRTGQWALFRPLWDRPLWGSR